MKPIGNDERQDTRIPWRLVAAGPLGLLLPAGVAAIEYGGRINLSAPDYDIEPIDPNS
jgi:hypothetical protein